MKNIYFLGDSLTAGTLSHNWVNDLKEFLPTFNVMNFGINGLTSCTLYHKLVKKITFDKPEIVVLMIGGNDIIGATDEACGNFYIDLAPTVQIEAPSLVNYERDLTSIVDKLDKELPVNAYLVVMSSPPIGEGGENGLQWILGDECNQKCEAIVNNSSHRVIYKNLFNEVKMDMISHLDDNHSDFKLSIGLMYLAWFLSIFLSFERVRWLIGFKYTTDGVHFCKEFGDICGRLVLEAIVEIEETNRI